MFSYHPSIFLSGTNLHNTLPIYNERVISQVKVNYIQFFQHIMEMKYTFYDIYCILLGTFQLNIFLVIGWKVGRHDIKLTLFYQDDDRKG